MAETHRKQVAVLFGGRSTEHEISIITGLEIIGAMDTEKYAPIPVYVDSRGRWFCGDALKDKAFYRQMPDSLSQVKEVTLLPIPGLGGLTVLSKKRGLFGGTKDEIIPVDVFFPAFHGTFGEDGCLQGLLEMADVVYAGCGVLSSSLAMNKYMCKSALHAHGIPVLPATVVSKQAMQKDVAKVREQIRTTSGLEDMPLFIKPVNLGSSVGIGRADDEPGLLSALAKAFEFDIEVIVEPCVVNRLEVNVSVMDYQGAPIVSAVEVPVASSDSLTYEDKYMRGGGKGKKGVGRRLEGMAGLTRVVDPEDLSQDIKYAVCEYAIEAYKVLACGGIVRFDFMIDTDTNSIYFNELNPLPGSMAFYLWEKSDPPVLYPEMLTRMIEGALARRELRCGVRRDLGFRALFS